MIYLVTCQNTAGKTQITNSSDINNHSQLEPAEGGGNRNMAASLPHQRSHDDSNTKHDLSYTMLHEDSLTQTNSEIMPPQKTCSDLSQKPHGIFRQTKLHSKVSGNHPIRRSI